MFDHSPSDRVQVRPIGSLRDPGTCALCGNGTNESGYVDFGLWLDYHGTVYLCVNPCALQIAEVIGCLVPEEAEHLKLVSEEIAKENRELREANELLTSRVAVVDVLISDAITRGTIKPPVVSEPEPSDVSNSNTTDGTNDGESESEESVKVGGPNDTERTPVRNQQRPKRKLDL